MKIQPRFCRPSLAAGDPRVMATKPPRELEIAVT
jgi:hypothetical protein